MTSPLVLSALVALGALAVPGRAAASQSAVLSSGAAPDTAEGARAASTRRRRRSGRPPRRLPLTPALVASAVDGPSTRALLDVARAARIRQDSSLSSYDATTYQRLSVRLGVGSLARDRLAFRSESVTRVRWRLGTGAYVDVTGARTVVPLAPSVTVDAGEIAPIPYHPGRETLWVGGSSAGSAVDENDGLVNPLADGSEAYYTFAAGDSASFRFPDGRTIRLRELRVRPRYPSWRLAVGSLWVEVSTGHLVRAAYRMSEPMDIGTIAREEDSTEFHDVPALLKPLLFPMTAQVTAIGVEYGLFQGRFWLPRLQLLQGSLGVGAVRLPVQIEQRYAYENVNAGAPVPPIAPPDSAAGDSTAPRRGADRRRECDRTGVRRHTRSARGHSLLVVVTVPCDSARLASSPDLPPTIYGRRDAPEGSGELEALIAQSLGIGAQAAFAPRAPVIAAERPRFNRVEGLSLGARLDRSLGEGYAVSVAGRVGLADREPNVEIGVARSDLRRTLRASAYNRLTAANDWGDPLSLGSSLSALLFGRDEGFYYRASGVALSSAPAITGAGAAVWSVFLERQRSAAARTGFSLARPGGGIVEPNIESVRATFAGVRARLTRSWGEDPRGLRAVGDLTGEGAGSGAAAYARGAFDLTLARPLSELLGAALTVAGGASAGALPAQRTWFIGGAQTVRGHAAGALRGDAFWVARAEVMGGVAEALRPVVFADVGWAGARAALAHPGQPLSGAGVGVAALDGLLRMDLSRGIFPAASARWRVDSYVSAAF